MDEPFAALDALTRGRMQDELLALWDEIKFTVIFVTHSIPEAVKIGNRILLLTPHPRDKSRPRLIACQEVRARLLAAAEARN